MSRSYYLHQIVAVAVRYGLAASLLATALACFCFDFFFLPPLYSLAIDDPFDVTAFLLFSIVGVIVSNLAARLRAQTHANIDRLHVIEALYSVSHELTAAANLQDVATVASRQAAKLLRASVVVLIPEDGALYIRGSHPPATTLSQEEMSEASRVWRGNVGSELLPREQWRQCSWGSGRKKRGCRRPLAYRSAPLA